MTVAAFLFVVARKMDGSTWRCLTAYSERVPFYQDRPHVYDVVKSLREACDERPSSCKEWTRTLASLDRQQADMPQVATLIERLSSTDWEERFIARCLLVTAGGEAVDPLTWLLADLDVQMGRTAEWLLQCIGRDTSERLSCIAPEILCPRCFTRFDAHFLAIPKWAPVTFYGCRTCQQSREYVRACIISVLDRRMQAHEGIGTGTIRINWLAERHPVDCDMIEILDAEESDVERLAVQVGNEADEAVRARYHSVPVTVDASCALSENALRILRAQFGRVEVRDERA